jgi:hypothetical protein
VGKGGIVFTLFDHKRLRVQFSLSRLDQHSGQRTI